MATRNRGEKPDNLTPQRARVTPRLGGPLTDAERAPAQAAFLAMYARTGNVSQSARRARISRETFYQWREHDEAFRTQLQHADADAQDVLRKETFRRAVIGVPEPITNAHGLVYEYEPVIGPDGQPEIDDRGRPKMKRGKVVTVKKYSDGLLQAMLKARVTEYRDPKRQIEISGPDGGPIATASEHALTINLDGMSVARLRALRDLMREDETEHETDGDSSDPCDSSALHPGHPGR